MHMSSVSYASFFQVLCTLKFRYKMNTEGYAVVC